MTNLIPNKKSMHLETMIMLEMLILTAYATTNGYMELSVTSFIISKSGF